MKRKIFMLLWELDLDKGGINKALQRRSRLLDNDEYDIELLTLDYKENYDKINDRLHKRGFLDPGTNIVNVNDYYRDKESSGTIGRKEKKFYDKEVKYHESSFFVEEHERYARYYKNGLYVKFKRWRKNGSLSHIHYFNEQRVLTHRIEFHQIGYKTREIYYSNTRSEERRVGKECRYTRSKRDWSSDVCSSDLHESSFFVEEHERYARYYKNGLYVKFKRWRKNGSLSHIHYFNEQRVLTHRIEFHQIGYKTREIYYSNTLENPVQELYFTKDGFCYLSKWYNAQTGKQEKVCLFSKKEKTVKTFKNNKQFHIYWLHEMCSKEKLKPFMICDGPGSAKKVGDLD